MFDKNLTMSTICKIIIHRDSLYVITNIHGVLLHV